jgi:integrase
MEKALVSFMYESGCRCPDELLHMKVGDVEFNDCGAKVIERLTMKKLFLHDNETNIN